MAEVLAYRWLHHTHPMGDIRNTGGAALPPIADRRHQCHDHVQEVILIDDTTESGRLYRDTLNLEFDMRLVGEAPRQEFFHGCSEA